MCHWLLGIKHVIFFIIGFPRRVDQKHLEAFFGQFGQIKKLIYHHQINFAIVQFCERYVLKRTVHTDCCLLGGIYLCFITTVDIVLLCFRRSAQICLSKKLYYNGHLLYVKRQAIRDPRNQGKVV
jgi:hypothetical protein